MLISIKAMAGSITTLQGWVFFSVFFIVYIIIGKNIKPFRIHKKRKYSTITLKASYLIFLGFYFTYIYLFLFSQKSRLLSEHVSDIRLKYYLGIFIFLTVIPHAAILIRRKIRKNRTNYNLIFSAINTVCIALILFILLSEKWGILT